ncbi:MAG: competence protein ComEA [Dehalococcoidia bacterium]|nr:competence protein ComEA [Dehalococcoidia bacterium]
MLAWLERNHLLILGFAGLVLLVGVLFPRLAVSQEAGPIVFNEGSGLPEGTPIRVHVAGAVLAPGVYELREGDRFAEALAAAGGPTADADLDGVNLARRVRDEGQVLIPRPAGAALRPEPLAPGAKLDINAASQAQLDLLPGIGEAYSRRIVDSRTVDGFFKSPQELVTRRVLPQATFDMIRDLIIAGP